MRRIVFYPLRLPFQTIIKIRPQLFQLILPTDRQTNQGKYITFSVEVNMEIIFGIHILLPSLEAAEYSLRNSQAYALPQYKYQLFKRSSVNCCLFIYVGSVVSLFSIVCLTFRLTFRVLLLCCTAFVYARLLCLY